MNCPSCGAALRIEGDGETFACDYCKNIYYPEKNDDGVRVLDAAKESCPVCAIALRHAILGRERIRYCTRCRGMLVRMETFVLLIQELRADAPGQKVQARPDPRELRRHIVCPQCHQQMDTHYYEGPGNIVIDSCSRCWVNWFDHGELMRVVAAPERSYEVNSPLGPDPRSGVN